MSSVHNLQQDLSRVDLEATGKIMNIPGVGALLGWGTSLPTDSGWAKGAIFHKYDGGVGVRLYQNAGDNTTASFAAIP